MMKTAIIYARVSSSGALENRQSTDRQVADLVDYATKCGWSIERVFEEHISGAKKNGGVLFSPSASIMRFPTI